MGRLIGKTQGSSGSELRQLALLRRRVHQSWKVTSISAFIGGVILSSAGLISGLGFFLVMVILLLLRPAVELYFSARAHCPHCEADLFMELCAKENREGIEAGLPCTFCGRDATEAVTPKAQVIDV